MTIRKGVLLGLCQKKDGSDELTPVPGQRVRIWLSESSHLTVWPAEGKPGLYVQIGGTRRQLLALYPQMGSTLLIGGVDQTLTPAKEDVDGQNE
jgi:hypothetical protein